MDLSKSIDVVFQANSSIFSEVDMYKTHHPVLQSVCLKFKIDLISIQVFPHMQFSVDLEM